MTTTSADITTDKLVELVKNEKEQWMKMVPDQPDMNPLVLVERGGLLRASVFAAKLDQVEGLRIAAVLRKGFAADRITMVCDAHMAKAEDMDSLKKWNEPGSMQRACDEQGLCKTREITDVMICWRIEVGDGKLRHLTAPYFYDEKYAASFHWLDSEISHVDERVETSAKMSGGGVGPLRKIMQLTPMADTPVIQMVARAFRLPDDREKKLYHTGLAALQLLTQMGNLCVTYDPMPQ